ncbi:uncharacterized protein LOC141911117 [Tubulanus polymorphus]|uniref:uncharacterized protein LOC141911117 n=1 Tax=Tubulanus polymorphus TaxID=672921 RepID=UPI003DA54C91
MKTRLFFIICTVLLQLGNLYNTQTSGAEIIYGTPHSARDAKPDNKTQGETIRYTCKIIGRNSTVSFQEKRNGSEQWLTVPDDQLNKTKDKQNVELVELKFQADFKRHNGSSFRCLVNESPTDPEPIQFDLIVVKRTEIIPMPDLKGNPDSKTQGEIVNYTCKIVGNFNATLTFQEKRRASEQWETIPDDKLHRASKKNVHYVVLKFQADFKLHNGTSFRCLVKESPTDREPIQFDLIVLVNRTDDSSSTQIPTTETTTFGVRLVTTEEKFRSKNKTDPTVQPTLGQTDRTTHDWTMTIVYIISGVIGFLLIIVIIVVIVCRRRRLSSGDRVDTTPESTTPQQQVEMVYGVNDELNDVIDSGNETDIPHTSNQKVTTDPCVDTEATNNKYTTPYMDMGAGGDTHRDQFSNPEPFVTYHQLTEDTGEPVKDDIQHYSYASVEYTHDQFPLRAATGQTVTDCTYTKHTRF